LITVLAGLAISLLTTLLPVIQASRTPVTLVLKNEQPLYSKNRQSIAAVLGLLCAAAGLVLPYPAKAILLFIGIILTFPTLITFAVRVFSPVVRGLFGQEGILAAANTLRKPVRSSSAAFLLCVAVSLLVLVNSVGAAFKQHVMDSTRSLLGGDVAFATSTPLEQKDLERIRKIPGVDRVNVFRQANILWKNHGKKRSILILGVPTDDRQAFPLFISPGKPVRPILEKLREPQTAVLGQGLYDKWGGRIGENIQFKTSTGTRSFKVVGTLFPERQRKCGLYVRRVVFGHRHPIRQGRRNPGRSERRSAGHQRAADPHVFGKVVNVQTMDEYLTHRLEAASRPLTLINLLLTLMMAVSGIGLLNTLIIQVLERTREIGVMRAVAYTRRQVVKMIVSEGLITGSTGTLAGIALGLYLSCTVLFSREVTGQTLPLTISWPVILGSAAFGLIVSLIASWIPAVKGGSIRLSEALRHE
jgi:putative ABC transport system permease protein